MRDISELISLDGRKALVSGGAGHIGHAAAEVFAELGAEVVLLDLDEAAVKDAAGSLSSKYGGVVEGLSCDLADEQQTRNVVDLAVETMGGLDILLHSAAFVGTTTHSGWSVRFPEQTVAAWDAGMRVNLTSAFVMVQQAREALAAEARGSVIFVSSIYGAVGSDPTIYEGSGMNPDRVLAYSASKGGLQQLAVHLSTLMAPQVRVNVVSPGGIERGQPDIFRQRYIERAPLKRMGTEEDLKGAFAYLASDMSAYVTGQNVLVDGGWTSW